jgi:hypothetical protein
MEMDEHVYQDDPKVGPIDVQTNLPETLYYFVGNGHILGAVQVCASNAATAIGLALMHADVFGPKRRSLSMDPENGLRATQIDVVIGLYRFQPDAKQIASAWIDYQGIPAVRLGWSSSHFNVTEIFYCPDRTQPRLLRLLQFESLVDEEQKLVIETGLLQEKISTQLTLGAKARGSLTLAYELIEEPLEETAQITVIETIQETEQPLLPETEPETNPEPEPAPAHEVEPEAVHDSESAPAQDTEQESPENSAPPPLPAKNPWSARVAVADSTDVSAPAAEFWQNLFHASFDHPVLDHLFNTAHTCLQHVISERGAVDASIWQYNLEWVRDHSMMALGLIMSGNYALAKTMLIRLLTQFVSEDGDTFDSSRKRPPQEIELDQNGELLLAIKTYVDYTGDWSFVEQHWEKITAVADFPLLRVFAHKESGLLHNRREFWERHAQFGIKDGMEITYQVFVSMGLACAAALAKELDKNKQYEKWSNESERLKQATLTDPKYRLIEHGHFIKRRMATGLVQSDVTVHPNTVLPPGVPLGEGIPHFLNPDSSIALPIAWEFIDPKGELAKNSLFQTERLWNQRWSFGGYGRYHVSSEPDSPGPWPFASMFIARAYLEHGQDDKVWRVLNWLNSLNGARSGSWYEFYGPRPCPPCPQVGFVPWTWAELLLFFVHHVFGIRPRKNKIQLRPHLLSGVQKMNASFVVQEKRIEVLVRQCREDESPCARVNNETVAYSIEKGLAVSLKNMDNYQIEICQ